MFFLLTAKVNATHIVGGDITYQYLGTDNYNITLNLFVDCINGDSNAILSDEFAIIGVFDNSGILVKKLTVLRDPPVRFQKLNYNCVTTAPNQCVDHYVYNQIVQLPKSPGGYTLAFQRCCRNNSILNLVDPGGTGATYWTKIPDVDTFGRNSSPTFDRIPPNFLCTNAPFSFLHSATDSDGDSLVYELYKPYDGGDDNTSVPSGHPLSPRPNPPLGPPYNNIIWLNPYGTLNMMAGTPKLTLDAETGNLYVVPNTLGQFVVGFKVKEYRNGVLIGETLRDFQFNVLNCEFEVVSRFDYDLTCDNNIKFTNESFSKNPDADLNYSWKIQEGGKQTNSEDKDIDYGKVAPGEMIVNLVARTVKCTDTLVRKVQIPEIIKVSISDNDTICANESSTFNATSNVPAQFKWPNTSVGENYTTNVTGNIKVVGTDARGCQDSATSFLFVKPLPVNTIGGGLNICRQFKEELDAGNPGANYKWSTGETTRKVFVETLGKISVEVDLSGCILTFEANYTDTLRKIDFAPDSTLFCFDATYLADAGEGFVKYLWQDGTDTRKYLIDTTGLYYVEVEDQYSCKGYDTAYFKIVPFFDIELGDGENICKDEFLRIADAKNPLNTKEHYQWSTSNEDTLSFLKITKPGKYWVDVTKEGCLKSDTIIYSDTNLVINLGDDTTLCSDDIELLFDAGDFVSYLWQDGSTERTYVATETENVTVQIIDTNECLGFGEFILTVNRLPKTGFGGKDTFICVAEDLILDAGDFVNYLWHTGSTDRILATRKEGANYVTLTDTNGCVNTDTIYVEISKNARNTDLFIPNAFSPNGDGLNDEFPYDFAIEGRRDFSLMIFTRWGEKVFESNDPTNLWDGSVSKDEWKYSNTFIFIMQWKGCDGKLELEKGIVMVLR